jgi:hypothetical protein
MYQMQCDRRFRVVQVSATSTAAVYNLSQSYWTSVKVMDKWWDADLMADTATRCTARRVLRSR